MPQEVRATAPAMGNPEYLLHLEIMSQLSEKWLVLMSGLFSFISTVAAVVLIGLMGTKDLGNLGILMAVASLANGALCLLVTLACLVTVILGSSRLLLHRNSERINRRTRVLANLNLVIILCHAVNLVFYTSASAYMVVDARYASIPAVADFIMRSCLNLLLLVTCAQLNLAPYWLDQASEPSPTIPPAWSPRFWIFLLTFWYPLHVVINRTWFGLDPAAEAGPVKAPTTAVGSASGSDGLPPSSVAAVPSGNHAGRDVEAHRLWEPSMMAHWIEACVWCGLQICLIVELCLQITQSPTAVFKFQSCDENDFWDDCWILECTVPPWTLAIDGLVTLFVVGYLILIMRFIYRALASAAIAEPGHWTSFSFGDFLIQLYAMYGSFAGLVPFLCLVIAQIWVSNARPEYSCLDHGWVYFVLQLKLTGIVVVLAFLFTPCKSGSKDPRYQEACQMFAWQEKNVEDVKVKRRQLLADQAEIDKEPMFSVEVAIKLLCWSALAYAHQKVHSLSRLAQSSQETEEPPETSTPPLMPTAMTMFSFPIENFTAISVGNMYAVLAWDNDKMVVAFRGTAQKDTWLRVNLRANRQVYPPGLPGHRLLHTQPLVHSGFLHAWQSLKDRVEEAICMRAMASSQLRNGRHFKVYFTGHSLGGALATIAGYDMSRIEALDEAGVKVGAQLDITVLTFGAPRLGNRAFSKLHEKAVPDTWHIINAKDPVSFLLKFLGAYKRSGHRVLIDLHRRMVVRPGYLQLRAHFHVPATNQRVSNHHHLLSSHWAAFKGMLEIHSNRGAQERYTELNQLLDMFSA